MSKPGTRHALKQLRKRIAMNMHLYRRRRWLTPSECATRAGISCENWLRYEAGRGNMTLQALLQVSTALGIQPEDLMVE